LHSEREPIPDAPAVYFVRPTEANVKRIAEDCAKQLYRTTYLHFISRVERSVMEKLAQELVATNSVSMISKIYDQYLDVIALEPSLFSLNIKDSFSLYNNPALNEQQIRSFMNRVAMGLLSTVRVTGSLPIIRAPPGGAAEMLSREFNTMLRENISVRGPAQSLFEDCLVQDRARPLMLILDRSSDLFPILQHTSTYQALISDLLDCKLNRVTIDVPDKTSSSAASGATKKKTYDLNTQSDHFLHRFASVPFPEAVENNEKELAEISQLEASLRSKQPSGFDEATAVAAASGSKAKDLSEALENLPEILLRKQTLETHTNLMHAIMKQISTRDIPTYFELEQNLFSMGVRSMDRAAVLALLRDGSKGSLHDKARLLVILAVLGDTYSFSKAGAEEYDAALQQGCAAAVTAAAGSPVPTGGGSAGADAANAGPSPAMIALTLSAVHFLRRLLSLQQQSSAFSGGAGVQSQASGLQSFFTSRAASLFAKATAFFTKFSPYYVTRVAHTLAEGRGGVEDETFLTLDPRSVSHPNGWYGPVSSGGAVGTMGASGMSDAGSGGVVNGVSRFADVIVFVLGGGSYTEYYNLQELVIRDAGSGSSGGNLSARESSVGSAGAVGSGSAAGGSSSSSSGGSGAGMATLRSVLYGTTDMLSGDDFMRQIEALASASK
jgi:hypothetical protein